MTVLLAMVATAAVLAAGADGVQCPDGMTHLDSFELAGASWIACENLQRMDGAIALLSSDGRSEWFAKGHEEYADPSAVEAKYYFNAQGLNKSTVVKDPVDILGQTILSKNFTHVSWQTVASAIPPIRTTGGARTFVGSRGSSVDTTFSDTGEDAAGYGFPPALSYVFNLTNEAEGGSFIAPGRGKASDYLNASGIAEGLVGGELPVIVFYYPVLPPCDSVQDDDSGSQPAAAECTTVLPPGTTGSRYWTMVAASTPDMKGSREQGVWFRYQQVACAAKMEPPCLLVGLPQYWDTYWWSRAPAGGNTELTGPRNMSLPNATGFYATLLENRRWWRAELAAEGMMELPSLPSPSTTNGTWIHIEARHNIILSMITWNDKWGPRYGVLPGYGITMQQGFEDTFTGVAMAALEWGAEDYARGFIDQQYRHYIRSDGTINYRANELAQEARMLTILALCYSYGICNDDFLLRHYEKAKAVAEMLAALRETALQYDTDDPRYGLIAGLDEGDTFTHVYFHQGETIHWYSHAAETYRAFTDLGEVWSAVGNSTGRADVAGHGAELLAIAPQLYRDLHNSMNKTANRTASPGHTCYNHRADGEASFYGCSFRAWPETFYSGALTVEQTDAVYIQGAGLTTCNSGRFLSLGVPSGGDGRMFVHIPQGFPYGLLVHDMVERFLLYFFTHSAHTNTRGTFTTPESSTLDRNEYVYAYASPGTANVPMCLKWMLCFEEPQTRTLWLGKAVPRDWLVAGEAPLVAENVTTRYGRISFSLQVSAGPSYEVQANVTLPSSFVLKPPPGGIRLRIRAPLAHAGRLSKVTVGGQAWSAFDASEETIDIAASQVTPELIATGLPQIVASFGARTAAPLRAALLNPDDRVVPTAAKPASEHVATHARMADESVGFVELDKGHRSCPDGMDQVDTFTLRATRWLACEDLQQPGGAIALISSAGDIEWFEKGYEPYRTNATDDSEYYLGLSKAAVVNATTDVLGAKLLSEHKAISWTAVESAVPPIRMPSGPKGAGCNTNRAVRTFVGSRTARVDATTDNHGGDSNWQGWPSWQSYAIDMHNQATGEPAQTYDGSGSADGLVGSMLPVVVFYTPMLSNSTLNNKTVQQPGRYWTVTQVGVQAQQCDATQNQMCNPEQNVLIRFQQVACTGPKYKPPCKLHGWPMYWDSYWFSRFPGANRSDADTQTLLTGPVNATSANQFYETLLDNKQYWRQELRAEGMMELKLPSPSTTNGTWLKTQALHSIVRSMITRQNTWEPRYGVCPGFGSSNFYGLQDVFTTTATAALEMGAMPYARGVIDYQYKHYIRPDGMVWYVAVELPATARMLTVLAKFHSYSGDDGFMLEHFAKAKALAELLESRRSSSMQFGAKDARYGIPVGGIDAQLDSQSTPLLMNHDEQPLHWYASAAETYRAFTDIGEVWSTIGNRTGRADVIAHGAELLKIAPLLYNDLHVSMNRTVNISSSGERCWALAAETKQLARDEATFRGYSEMLYSGALTAAQADDIYKAASGGSTCGAKRFLTLGSPGIGGTTIATPTPYGFAHALLQHDRVEKFLLHFFAVSAHGYTRGTFTTPESSDVGNRDVAPAQYVSAGVVLVPTYLKWMLCFEEPQTRTLWLGKAVPRDWLVAGEAPLVAENVTTRYGRISFSLQVSAGPSYEVQANVTLPSSFVLKPPPGGIRLRIRAPLAHAGRLSKVTVGGQAWSAFDASEETIDIAASQVTPELIATGLPQIVASFGARTAAPLGSWLAQP